MPDSYFSAETSLSTRAFYAVLCLLTLVYSLIGLFSPLLVPKCDMPLLDKVPTPKLRVLTVDQTLSKSEKIPEAKSTSIVLPTPSSIHRQKVWAGGRRAAI